MSQTAGVSSDMVKILKYTKHQHHSSRLCPWWW